MLDIHPLQLYYMQLHFCTCIIPSCIIHLIKITYIIILQTSYLDHYCSGIFYYCYMSASTDQFKTKVMFLAQFFDKVIMSSVYY